MTDHKPSSNEKSGESQKRYNVTWHCQVIKIGKKPHSLVSLAICEYSEGVCFVAVCNPNEPMNMDVLKILLLRDVYVGEECEDSAYCFNIDCPKNRAIISAFNELGIETKEHLENVHKNLEYIRRDMELETAEHCVNFYYKKPTVYKLPAKRKRKG